MLYNDAICTRMLQMLQINCRFLSGVVQKLYKAELNFKKLKYCYYSYSRLSESVTIMDNNWIARKAVQWCHLHQNVANAPNYLWICFRSRTKIVQGTIEFQKNWTIAIIAI